MTEEWSGLSKLTDFVASISGTQAKSYEQFYKQIFETASTIAQLLLRCGCVGVMLPRGYRLMVNNSNLLLQRRDDPYNDGRLAWHTINAASADGLPPRSLVMNFYRDLNEGWLDNLASMLEHDFAENAEVAAKLHSLTQNLGK